MFVLVFVRMVGQMPVTYTLLYFEFALSHYSYMFFQEHSIIKEFHMLLKHVFICWLNNTYLLILLFHVLQSFITQDSRDRDFLVKNLKSFDVPVLNYTGNGTCHREPFQISEQVCVFGAIFYKNKFELVLLTFLLFTSVFYEQMSALEIYSRLDQVFDAPTAVKEVLISQFGLDRSV